MALRPEPISPLSIPEDIFQAAREEDDSSSFGSFSIGDLLAPLRVLSFWKMKDRARKFESLVETSCCKTSTRQQAEGT